MENFFKFIIFLLFIFIFLLSFYYYLLFSYEKFYFILGFIQFTAVNRPINEKFAEFSVQFRPLDLG